MRPDKKFWIWGGVTLGVTLLLPWLAVRVFGGDAGMAICLILFFGADPLYAFALGIVTGAELKKRWLLPLLMPGCFLLSSALLFTLEEKDFFLYAGMYLLISAVAAAISFLVTHHNKERRS